MGCPFCVKKNFTRTKKKCNSIINFIATACDSFIRFVASVLRYILFPLRIETKLELHCDNPEFKKTEEL